MSQPNQSAFTLNVDKVYIRHQVELQLPSETERDGCLTADMSGGD